MKGSAFARPHPNPAIPLLQQGLAHSIAPTASSTVLQLPVPRWVSSNWL